MQRAGRVNIYSSNVFVRDVYVLLAAQKHKITKKKLFVNILGSEFPQDLLDSHPFFMVDILQTFPTVFQSQNSPFKTRTNSRECFTTTSCEFSLDVFFH